MNDRAIPEARVFDGIIDTSRAWTSREVADERWNIAIPAAALAEIDAMLEILRANPLDTPLLSADDYALDACRALIREVKARLDGDVGVVVLDRLPVARYSKAELTAVYWVLSSMIARPVAQAFDGRVLYDVLDTGKPIDTRVRGDLTGQELIWHSDYGFNFPPPYIGLLVLRTAREGGVSSAASMMTAHNVLRQKAPHLLRRLYQPFYWNRQGEHGESDPITHFYPVFSYDGATVRGRFNRRLIYKGHELAGVPLDDLGRQAVETMFDVMSEPEHHFTFELAAGQIQYMNNFGIAHRRTQYSDYDEPAARRHLVRIFLRNEGRRSYMG